MKSACRIVRDWFWRWESRGEVGELEVCWWSVSWAEGGGFFCGLRVRMEFGER